MTKYSKQPGPIGIFDSGYGGLTILHGIRQLLPEYDYLYLGDNARAPYGSRSFDVVYQFTRQAVMKLFDLGCQLVILGCNTASAKALRTIQQNDLPNLDPDRRVLGVIRPTAEVIGKLTHSRHVGVLATEGTIKSNSYNLEIQKLWEDVKVTGVPCPLWVPIIENNEADSPGADYQWSLRLLKEFKAMFPHIPTKSGLMVGLGETNEEILEVMQDLRDHGVTMLTVGQYLQPSRHHLPVARYVPPAEFDMFREKAQAMGFEHAACGPFVRSSYHADLQASGGLVK